MRIQTIHSAPNADSTHKASPSKFFREVLEEALSSQAQFTGHLDALRTGTLDSAELLAVQIEVHRWSQSTELVSRTVGKGSEGIETLLRTHG